jgi:hypothetical protein
MAEEKFKLKDLAHIVGVGANCLLYLVWKTTGRVATFAKMTLA